VRLIGHGNDEPHREAAPLPSGASGAIKTEKEPTMNDTTKSDAHRVADAIEQHAEAAIEYARGLRMLAEGTATAVEFADATRELDHVGSQIRAEVGRMLASVGAVGFGMTFDAFAEEVRTLAGDRWSSATRHKHVGNGASIEYWNAAIHIREDVNGKGEFAFAQEATPEACVRELGKKLTDEVSPDTAREGSAAPSCLDAAPSADCADCDSCDSRCADVRTRVE
jgi:hypothetical protein